MINKENCDQSRFALTENMIAKCSIRNMKLIGSTYKTRNYSVSTATRFVYRLPGSIKAFNLLGAAYVSTLPNVTPNNTFCSSKRQLANCVLSVTILLINMQMTFPSWLRKKRCYGE